MKVEFKHDEVILHLPVLTKHDMNVLIEAIEKLYATFEQNKAENELLQKYIAKLNTKTDITQILQNYKQPDMSIILGVLPDDEPFEKLIQMI